MDYHLIISFTFSLILLIPTISAFMNMELRPGYGVRYSPIGKVYQGLNRYNLIIGHELPEKWPNLGRVGNNLPKTFQKFCDNIKNDTVAFDVCHDIIPYLKYYANLEKEYQTKIRQKLNYDLVAILPDIDERNNIDKAEKIRGQDEYSFKIIENVSKDMKHPFNPDLPIPEEHFDENHSRRVEQYILDTIEQEVSNHMDDTLDDIMDEFKDLQEQMNRQIARR